MDNAWIIPFYVSIPDFWTKEKRRTCNRIGLEWSNFLLLNRFADSEISDFDLPIFQEDVFCFDVPMEDAIFLHQKVQSTHALTQELNDFFLSVAHSCFFPLNELIVQAFVGKFLHNRSWYFVRHIIVPLI